MEIELKYLIHDESDVERIFQDPDLMKIKAP